jgi:anaerobic carbon-monoxide dehydrogenase catalytic subunit
MSKHIFPGDSATKEMRAVAEDLSIETIWDRKLKQEPHCGFGTLGVCCKNCNLGPCRIDPFGEGAQYGVCGADADVIAARNLLRHIAAGSACHNDHGREIIKTLLLVGTGEAQGYKINDAVKLERLAKEYGLETSGKDINKLARELAERLFREYGQQDGELMLAQRAPKKQIDIWRANKLMPRGVDREVTEALARTNMGVDNDYRSLMSQGMRTALSDGWGGSMIATDLSDILFGSPEPLRAKANLGVLKVDQVNIIVHGHVPILSDAIATASVDPALIQLAKEKGAAGINLAGICCTALEVLSRKGVNVAGNFLQQELALITGAVDLMIVDLQCVMPSLPNIASCFHTKVVSTNPRAHFPGSVYIEFHEEKGMETARNIITMAIENFPKRNKSRVHIPKESRDLVGGFSTEYIFKMLGGNYRSTFSPLNEAIISGRIRGVAGVVGCDNPKLKSGETHITLVKELIKKDVLVVQTGCAATACAKEGLLVPEAAFKYAGKGLQEICAAVGCPPVLHLGPCVDNSRILTACCEMVKEGGIGKSLDELPVAGAAPEWMSEKAIAIGWYFVASGAMVVFGNPYPLSGSHNLTKFVTEDVESITGGKWAFESDPVQMAKIIIEHIDKKRQALKLKPMMYP